MYIKLRPELVKWKDDGPDTLGRLKEEPSVVWNKYAVVDHCLLPVKRDKQPESYFTNITNSLMYGFIPHYGSLLRL